MNLYCILYIWKHIQFFPLEQNAFIHYKQLYSIFLQTSMHVWDSLLIFATGPWGVKSSTASDRWCVIFYLPRYWFMVIYMLLWLCWFTYSICVFSVIQMSRRRWSENFLQLLLILICHVVALSAFAIWRLWRHTFHVISRAIPN
jgi:hypothetical protein